MSGDASLEARFESSRDQVRGVAYRVLGSLDDADDAVQRAWLRADQADLSGVENLTGWLTTVTARVCLDMLRTRRSRNERPLTVAPSGPAASTGGVTEPEEEAVLAESVGLALLVVLDRLSPAQRVAFVLHDLFAVPFEEIAVVVDRSTVATKKLASRARARVRGVTTVEAAAPAEHYAVVDAFLAAARGGDLGTLLELLAPDVVRRADRFAASTGISTEVRGARAVADETKVFAARARTAEVALVDGVPGIVVAPLGRLFAVLRMTVYGGRITDFDVIADPAQLDQITLAIEGRRHIEGGRPGQHHVVETDRHSGFPIVRVGRSVTTDDVRSLDEE
ncbi:MAG: sigma-70 family RNA polymerase sigma factor [Acidimicrobiia bacterium]|jgi:RNA polymerase sigma-70 factor (ECF subfamily)|nr:sigma-70 family RNA polymerase sigma factor [Acidimicrobiia bacterium]MBA3984176.1 sigma-70 family RNA polymerase sigma factor [Acidimicrobiia bacterium]